jgi:hypothetical protein
MDDGFVAYMRDFDTGDYEDTDYGGDDCNYDFLNGDNQDNYDSSSDDGNNSYNRVVFCNSDDSSSECGTYYTDFSSEQSFTYSDFTHELEDFCALPKVDVLHGKAKDQRRLLRKKNMIQFVKSLNGNELNLWEKHKKNKSMKANKKWNQCEMSQILC